MINTVKKNIDPITNEFCSYQVTQVGTNIVFRSTDVIAIKKSLKKFFNILKSNDIVFSIEKKL